MECTVKDFVAGCILDSHPLAVLIGAGCGLFAIMVLGYSIVSIARFIKKG